MNTNGVPPWVENGADGGPAIAAHHCLPSPARRATHAPSVTDAPPRGRRSSDAAAPNVQYGLCAYGARPPRPGGEAPPTPSRQAGVVPGEQDGGRVSDGAGALLGSASGGEKPCAPRTRAVLGAGRYGYHGTVYSIAREVAAGRRQPHPTLLIFLYLCFAEPDILHTHPSTPPAALMVRRSTADAPDF